VRDTKPLHSGKIKKGQEENNKRIPAPYGPCRADLDLQIA
jgi:hypothetical protein